jgi:hypothetical protein
MRIFGTSPHASDAMIWFCHEHAARSPSGKAKVCKTFIGGSIPPRASNFFSLQARPRSLRIGSELCLNPAMENVLKLLALLSSGMFGGAALYLTTVEHPARMTLGASAALQEFRPSYKRAAPPQAVLAMVCFLCGVSLAVLTQSWFWLLGGILVGAVVPFTLVFIMPTNRLLLDESGQLDAQVLESLLAKWARLHAVRSVLSVLGFLVLLWACVLRS